MHSDTHKVAVVQGYSNPPAWQLTPINSGLFEPFPHPLLIYLPAPPPKHTGDSNLQPLQCFAGHSDVVTAVATAEREFKDCFLSGEVGGESACTLKCIKG